MKHVVQFSTGAASAEVAWRVVNEHGAHNTILLTADTRVEDNDNWRFAQQVWDRLGHPDWTRLADGRTPMQVGRDRKCVPSNQRAVCSEILKRKLLRAWIDSHCDPAYTVIYVGYDWTEQDRHDKAVPHWAPYRVESPLLTPPYVNKPDLLDLFRSRGIEPPRLYAMGYSHANCSGCCVRGGQAQWALTLRVQPERYAEWEAEEEKTRAELGKDVAMMSESVRGVTTPLPLRMFRERLERQPSLFDADDWGACGCTDFAAVTP